MITTLLLAAAVAVAPTPARSPSAEDPATLALVVASNRGARGGRPPLQYADDDGAKYFEVLATIAGEENTVLLTDLDRDTARLFPALLDKVRSPTRAQLELAASRLARRSAELRRSGRPVRFLFVFAGHGDVDRGRGFLELADGAFTADDVQALLRTVDASEAHVILDSCNSFFVVNPRRPGGTRFATPQDAAEALGRRLPNVGVFLSTSAQAEVYEWSELQSGVFSHAVRSGLLGAADANGDGQVSYEELAAFVETAVADIKNPLYRPTVYARGPNGEGARAIVAIPAGARTVLAVDEPGAVRLALRDGDGLRWLDAYKEPGVALRVWVPGARRMEVDRLKPGPAGRGEVDATFSVPADAEGTVALAALPPAGAALALRGPGDVFQALFSRPFGPVALASYLEARGEREAMAMQVAAAGADGAPARLEPAAAGAEAEGRSPAADSPGYLALRAGALVPWLSGRAGLAGPADASPVRSFSAVLGRELNAIVALELEAGYLESRSTGWTYDYPTVGYDANPVRNTTARLQAVPAAVNARFQVPLARARPYLTLGGGLALAQLTLDPPDFNATLRATRLTPFAHGRAGVAFDVGRHLFGALEGGYSILNTFSAHNARLAVSGVTASVLVGARL